MQLTTNHHRPSRTRFSVLVAAVLAVVQPFVAASVSAEGSTSVALPATAGPAWIHERVQRAPDPAVRFGRLPNGLRYAIQHNETPKDGVAMRLRIGSGSLQERDGEQGLAHFLEHMAFRGSTKVPDGEVVHMLQRQGLAFGPDTNAFTAQDQTVYHFNFPKADKAALDTGLLLLREVADQLTLDPKLIEQEKGVILSEERARDVPTARAQKAEINHVLAGTRVPARWPIGEIDVIKGATAEKLRRYYAANYRPDNATLVVVGNVDVDAVERQLRETFADWQARGAVEAVRLGAPQPALQSAEFVAEGAPDVMTLTWLLPPDHREPTLAVEREHLVAQLGMAVLNVHLAEHTLKPGSPFVQAVALLQPKVFKVTGFAKLVVVAPEDKWSAALDASLTELRQLLLKGVQPADLQRVLPTVKSSLEAAVAQSVTRPHAAIADALVKSVHEDDVYRSASQSLADAQPMLASVTADEVTASLRRSFGAGVPLLFRSAHAGAVGAEALTQQLAQSLQRPVQAAAAAVAATWPYTDFGEPSTINARTADTELGFTTVEFANGTRLWVKSTAQEKDKVDVQVLLGHGRAGLLPEQTHALWALDALPLGGTGKRSLAEVMQWQQSSGKQFNVALRMDPRAAALIGRTRPADLDAQLQVLAAYARDPGFRPELGDKLMAAGPMVAHQLETQPGLVYGREVTRVMTGGDGRLAGPPSAADIAATKPADIEAALRAPLSGPADVILVGDVSVETAIAAVKATFGSGPVLAHSPAPKLSVVAPKAGGAAHVVSHAGRADQAILGWHWAMPDHWADPGLAATGRVAAAVLQARLVDTVRAKLGITYSPSAGSSASIDVLGRGSFSAQLETPPDKFEAFRTLLKQQLLDLASKPIDADELQRARQPLVEARRKAAETNGHWSFWLAQLTREPRARTLILGEADNLQAVSVEQVQSFFRDRIGAQPPIEIIAKARDSAADGAATTGQ